MGAGGGGFVGWGALGSCGLDSFSEEDILGFCVEWMIILLGISQSIGPYAPSIKAPSGSGFERWLSVSTSRYASKSNTSLFTSIIKTV